mmetsp:Transcript_95349/g.199460  ORF Transcript_95349/g.199460 Transcript_95349/m.199460 type:complete len:715 (-) Transcript_95349:261-2405(-)
MAATPEAEAFLRSAYAEIRAPNGGVIGYLLKLLLPTLRAPVGGQFPEDCPIEEMRAALAICRDVPGKCACVICTEQLESGYYQKLPGSCTDTKGNILAQVLARLSSDFDETIYSPGDVSRLVTGRFRTALLQRKQQRKNARKWVRKCLIDDHKYAQRKKTARLQGLRDSMGDAAFERMVVQQVEARRARGYEDTVARREAWRWWNREGHWYRQGPPVPDHAFVNPILTPQPGCLQKLSSTPEDVEGGRQTVLTTDNPLAAPLTTNTATPDVVLEVPTEMVAKCAAAVQDWNRTRGCLFHSASCSATLRLNFDGNAGERVPRVHMTSKPGEPLVVMDAASLENLRDGDLLGGILRLVRVGGTHNAEGVLDGRVIAMTGSETVAVALPRPYDRFDVEFRGNIPPSSQLPVGWDVTQTASEATLVVSWPLSRRPPIVLRIVSSEAVEDLDPEDFIHRIESVLREPYEVSHRRYKFVEDTLCFAPRLLMRSMDKAHSIMKKFSEHGYDLWTYLTRPLLRLLKKTGSSFFDNVLRPLGRSYARVDAYLREEVFIPILERVSQWARNGASNITHYCNLFVEHVLHPSWRALYNNILRPVGNAVYRCISAVSRPPYNLLCYVCRGVSRVTSNVASGVWNKVSSLAASFSETVSNYWARDPIPRRCLRHIDNTVDAVGNMIWGTLSKIGEACSRAWRYLVPERQQVQVRLTRVRQRHDFHVR